MTISQMSTSTAKEMTDGAGEAEVTTSIEDTYKAPTEPGLDREGCPIVTEQRSLDALSQISEKHAIARIGEAQTTYAAGKKKKTGIAGWWDRKVKPLIRNKVVHTLSLPNLVMAFIVLVLIIILVVLGLLLLFKSIKVNHLSNLDRPCLYRWSRWDACNGICWNNKAESSPPRMNRTVVKDSIVYARGKFKEYRDCPKDLEDIVDHAPCNVDLCAKTATASDEDSECFAPIGPGVQDTCVKRMAFNPMTPVEFPKNRDLKAPYFLYIVCGAKDGCTQKSDPPAG